jgi:hypothetical protein
LKIERSEILERCAAAFEYRKAVLERHEVVIESRKAAIEHRTK